MALAVSCSGLMLVVLSWIAQADPSSTTASCAAVGEHLLQGVRSGDLTSSSHGEFHEDTEHASDEHGRSTGDATVKTLQDELDHEKERNVELQEELIQSNIALRHELQEQRTHSKEPVALVSKKRSRRQALKVVADDISACFDAENLAAAEATEAAGKHGFLMDTATLICITQVKMKPACSTVLNMAHDTSKGGRYMSLMLGQGLNNPVDHEIPQTCEQQAAVQTLQAIGDLEDTVKDIGDMLSGKIDDLSNQISNLSDQMDDMSEQISNLSDQIGQNHQTVMQELGALNASITNHFEQTQAMIDQGLRVGLETRHQIRQTEARLDSRMLQILRVSQAITSKLDDMVMQIAETSAKVDMSTYSVLSSSFRGNVAAINGANSDFQDSLYEWAEYNREPLNMPVSAEGWRALRAWGVRGQGLKADLRDRLRTFWQRARDNFAHAAATLVDGGLLELHYSLQSLMILRQWLEDNPDKTPNGECHLILGDSATLLSMVQHLKHAMLEDDDFLTIMQTVIIRATGIHDVMNMAFSDGDEGFASSEFIGALNQVAAAFDELRSKFSAPPAVDGSTGHTLSKILKVLSAVQCPITPDCRAAAVMSGLPTEQMVQWDSTTVAILPTRLLVDDGDQDALRSLVFRQCLDRPTTIPNPGFSFTNLPHQSRFYRNPGAMGYNGWQHSCQYSHRRPSGCTISCQERTGAGSDNCSIEVSLECPTDYKVFGQESQTFPVKFSCRSDVQQRDMGQYPDARCTLDEDPTCAEYGQEFGGVCPCSRASLSRYYLIDTWYREHRSPDDVWQSESVATESDLSCVLNEDAVRKVVDRLNWMGSDDELPSELPSYGKFVEDGDSWGAQVIGILQFSRLVSNLSCGEPCETCALPTERTQDNHCATCISGHELVGLDCIAPTEAPTPMPSPPTATPTVMPTPSPTPKPTLTPSAPTPRTTPSPTAQPTPSPTEGHGGGICSTTCQELICRGAGGCMYRTDCTMEGCEVCDDCATPDPTPLGGRGRIAPGGRPGAPTGLGPGGRR